MAMSKKHFIALAEAIIQHNQTQWADGQDRQFSPEQLEALAGFCKAQNPNLDWERWLGFIAGENGPNGGAVKR